MRRFRWRSETFSGLNSWFLHVLPEGSNVLAETHSLKPDHIKVFWAEVKVGLLITSSVPHDPPLLEQSQAFNFILFLNLICGQLSLRMIDVKLSILWAKTGL